MRGHAFDEVPWSEAGKRRLGKMRVLRDEARSMCLQICEVAAPAAGDSDFLCCFFCMVENQDLSALARRLNAREKPRRTGSKDNYVHLAMFRYCFAKV